MRPPNPARKSRSQRQQRKPLKDVLNEDIPLFSDHPLLPAKTYMKKVAFSDDPEYIAVPKVSKVRKRAARKASVCTPQALAEAYAKANLPDFDAIAKHELNIVVKKPWQLNAKPQKPVGGKCCVSCFQCMFVS